MSRTTAQRWTIATLGFLLIAWIDLRYGHAVALGTLLALMLLVAVYGGSGYGGDGRRGSRSSEQGTHGSDSGNVNGDDNGSSR